MSEFEIVSLIFIGVFVIFGIAVYLGKVALDLDHLPLINLKEYENECLRSYKRGGIVMPVPCIPESAYGWKPHELQKLRENRDEAQAIYDRVMRWGV